MSKKYDCVRLKRNLKLRTEVLSLSAKILVNPAKIYVGEVIQLLEFCNFSLLRVSISDLHSATTHFVYVWSRQCSTLTIIPAALYLVCYLLLTCTKTMGQVCDSIRHKLHKLTSSHFGRGGGGNFTWLTLCSSQSNCSAWK